MIRFAAKRAALLGLAAALGLSACGNTQRDIGQAFVLAAKTNFGNRNAKPARVSVENIVGFLSASNKPAALIVLEERDSQTLMVEIERNGRYQTFASGQRRAATTRGGMLTSTRGLGGDLMSSDIDELLSVVQSRSPGIADMSLRLLDSEDVTYTLSYTCAVHVGGPTQVVSATVNEPGLAMQAICTGTGPSFTNTYVVGGDGYILSTRQWTGDFNKYISFQMIRR